MEIEKVSERVVLKEQWSLVRVSFTWKKGEKVSERVVLKEQWSLVRVSFTWK